MPQYMPAEPAVMERIFTITRLLDYPITRLPAFPIIQCSELLGLEGSGPEEELDESALVRLQPVQLDCRHRSEVESSYVHRVEQRSAERRVARDRRADQRRADRIQHV